MRTPFVVIASIFLLAAGALPRTGSAVAQEDPLQIVSTFSILTDLIENVGGDLVQVETLVPSNMDAHTFEPSPEKITTLTEASIIFENGLDFEPWLDRMVEAASPDAVIVAVSDGVTVRSSDGTSHDHEEDEADDDHGESDPHIWHDPANVMIMVENIRDALIATEPEHADEYEANTASYLAELELLDQWIVERVDTLPADQRLLVTSHDNFGYFADRYGFDVLGTPLGGSTETAEPAAKDIAALIETIQESGVPAIFAENVGNPSIMEQLASNAGVVLAPSLYTDSLGEPDSPGATYLSMMRYNVETIVTALAG